MKKGVIKKISVLLFFAAAGLLFAAEKGAAPAFRFSAENIEVQFNRDVSLAWEASLMFGGAFNKIYLYSEGEAEDLNTQEIALESENRLVYSRAILPLWDWQIGFQFDTLAEFERATQSSQFNYFWGAVTGIRGTLPYFIEASLDIFLNNNFNVGFRSEIEYELMFTQKLKSILTFTIDFYTKDEPAMELGRGLSSTDLGLILQYAIVREFAPYIGVSWKRNYFNTAAFDYQNEAAARIGFAIWF